jgi:hypothetical protein
MPIEDDMGVLARYHNQADDPLGRAAGHVDGAMSILTGIAANRSMATGLPVTVANLVNFH